MSNKLLYGGVLAVMLVITVIFAVIVVMGGDKKELSGFNENGQHKKTEANAVKTDEKDTAEQQIVSEPEPEPQKVSFVAVGDNIVHSSVYDYASLLAEGTEKEYDFLPMYENVADVISTADLAYVNQEAPIAGKALTYSGYPMFNSPEQAGYDLVTLGFDVVNLANNHMLDRYAKGYRNTVDFWKNIEGVTYIGGYENEEDYNNIRVVEKNGITIAFLSYTYGTNGVRLDGGSEMIIPLCDEAGTSEIDRQTKLARELADVVMVSVHWGYEDHFAPSALQERQMQVMVDNGVDVIIGTHPHVLQPMLWKERQDGKKTLVIYSLGNFLSGMLYARNMVGGIAGFDIVKDGENTKLENVYFIPTMCHYESVDGVRTGFKLYRFSEYTDELFSRHGTQVVSDRGRSLEYLRGIIDGAIDKEFLTEDFYRGAE